MLAWAPEWGWTLTCSAPGNSASARSLREVLDDVHVLAAAVVALARQALGVLVGQPAALRLEDRREDVVLAGDQLDVVVLATALALHRRPQLGIDLGSGPGQARRGSCSSSRRRLLRPWAAGRARRRPPGAVLPTPRPRQACHRVRQRPHRGRRDSLRGIAPARRIAASRSAQSTTIDGRAAVRSPPSRTSATASPSCSTTSPRSARRAGRRGSPRSSAAARPRREARGAAWSGTRTPIVGAPVSSSGSGARPCAGAGPASSRPGQNASARTRGRGRHRRARLAWRCRRGAARSPCPAAGAWRRTAARSRRQRVEPARSRRPCRWGGRRRPPAQDLDGQRGRGRRRRGTIRPVRSPGALGGDLARGRLARRLEAGAPPRPAGRRAPPYTGSASTSASIIAATPSSATRRAR